MKMFRFLFLTLFPVVLGFDYDTSDKCEESAIALFNTAIQDELSDLYKPVSIDEACNNTDGKEVCTLDFTPLVEEHEEICTKFGGVSSAYSFELDCEYTIFKILNEPWCTGADCTVAEREKIFYYPYDDDKSNCTLSYVSAASSAAPTLGLSSVLVSVAMSGLWWLYNL